MKGIGVTRMVAHDRAKSQTKAQHSITMADAWNSRVPQDPYPQAYIPAVLVLKNISLSAECIRGCWQRGTDSEMLREETSAECQGWSPVSAYHGTSPNGTNGHYHSGGALKWWASTGQYSLVLTPRAFRALEGPNAGRGGHTSSASVGFTDYY